MIAAAATVAVYVEDTDASLGFWVEKVGFEVRVDRAMGAERWVEVGPPGAETALVLYPRKMMKGWESQRASIVFECDDIEATYATLVERGVTIELELRDMPWGKFAAFQDDLGNGYGLRQK